MRNFQFDWRWVVVIGVVLLLFNVGRIPPVILAVLVGAGGAYLLRVGWQILRRTGAGASRGRVTYWRGQRVEIGPERRGPAMPRLGDIGPAILPLLIGAVMVLAAASMLFNALPL